jgi:hypothetical protein
MISKYLESGQIYGLLTDMIGRERRYEIVDGEAHGGERQNTRSRFVEGVQV